MNRRSFVQHSALAFGAMTLMQKQFLGSFFEDPWKIQMLTDDLGVFTEKGGTILFTLSKKGMVVVDSEFPEQSKHLIDELKKRNSHPFEKN